MDDDYQSEEVIEFVDLIKQLVPKQLNGEDLRPAALVAAILEVGREIRYLRAFLEERWSEK